MLRNRIATFILALLCLLLKSAPSQAAQNFFTGNSVQSLSEESRLFFISGMVQMSHIMNEAEGSSFEKKICYPDGVDAHQLNLVVQKYFEANPEKLHWPASVLTWNALKTAFPCQ